MVRYQVTFDMPVRLAAGDRAMAIAGRLDEALQGLATRGVTDPELATHRVRRTRLRSVTVTMTVRAPDASRALSLGFDALRSALGRDVRAWDVPGTGVTVVPVTPGAPPRPTVTGIRAARARAARSGLAALLIGALAGLLPANKAARMSPTQALRSIWPAAGTGAIHSGCAPSGSALPVIRAALAASIQNARGRRYDHVGPFRIGVSTPKGRSQ